MIFKSVYDQLLEQRRENERLRAKLAKNEADTAYIAMMADVELEQDEEQEEIYEPEV